MKYLAVGILSAALTVLWAQNSPLTPRQLYFGAARAKAEAEKSGSKDAPPKSKQSNQAQAKQNNGAKAKQAPNNGKTNGNPATPENSPARQNGSQAALASSRPDRLGLRYNLLKVDPKTGRVAEVDPDQNFSPGDCFAVRLQPNRSGRIYVFNKASSERWQVLLPSAEMPDERNDIQAGRSITVPHGYCFGLDDPPGTDTLLVAMTDRSDDIQELDNYVRASDPARDTPAPAQPAPKAQPGKQQGAQMLLAGLGYDAVVSVTKVIDQGPQMISRDVVIQKIANPEPEYDEEPANSVYIVKTAATDQDRLVIEIPIRHEPEQ